MNLKLIIVMVGLLIVWGTFFYVILDYGKEVRQDPCSICAKRMGENVICTLNSPIPTSRVYYPNGTIIDINNEVAEVPRTLDNLSVLKNLINE